MRRRVAFVIAAAGSSVRTLLRSARRPHVISTAACLLLASGIEAATKTWNGTVSPLWSDGGNWTPSGTPVAGDDLVFPSGASNLANTNNFVPVTSFNSITFNGAGGGYTLNGSAIRLGGGGIAASNAIGFNVIALDIVLTASQTFSLPEELDLNGNLDLGANNLTVDGSAATSFFQGVISGTGTLTKSGTATLVYAGAWPNTMAGTTTVKAGTLRANKPRGVVAIAGPLVIGDGAGSAAVSLALDEQIANSVPVTINSSAMLDLATFGGLIENIGSLAGSGSVDLGSGLLHTGGNNASTTFSGVISGTGYLVKDGTGTMTLTAANTHTGASIVLDGTLLVNGSEIGPVFTWAVSGRAGGTGTVPSLLIGPGAVNPGVSGPGIFNASNDAGVTGTGSLTVELNGPVAGTGYDQLNVGGTVTLGGSLNVLLGFVPAPGESFTIINNAGSDPIVGTFARLPEGATFVVSGITFRISYVGGTGNDVVLTAVAPAAPIPALSFPMMLLLIFALAASAMYVVRRRQ